MFRSRINVQERFIGIPRERMGIQRVKRGMRYERDNETYYENGVQE